MTAPSGSALKTRLLRLAEKKPDEVKIIAENTDGSIFAHVPVKYIKINPSRQISEEQKEILRQRILEQKK